MSFWAAATSSVRSIALSSFLLGMFEYSSSVRSWMSVFRSEGIT